MFHAEKIQETDKKSFYGLLIKQLEALLEGETNRVANLANASALLNQTLDTINWVGFYLIEQNAAGQEALILGPFQGKVACVHIQIGRGVCGTAVAEDKTQVVRDVHAFPGHIACDGASRSEIVVPIRSKGKVVGVLDIDSPVCERFDDEDAYYLEQLVTVLEQSCGW